MDIADIAQARMESEEELRRKFRPQRAAPPATGACFNCEASVLPPARFCDAECAAEYEQFSRRMTH